MRMTISIIVNNNENDNFHHRQQQHYRQDIQSRLLPLPQRGIIFEEDIEITNDFFSLMNATADLLNGDVYWLFRHSMITERNNLYSIQRS
jgi:hypothetical protein